MTRPIKRRKPFAASALALTLAVFLAPIGCIPELPHQNVSSHQPEFFRALLSHRVWISVTYGHPWATYFAPDGTVKECRYNASTDAYDTSTPGMTWRIGTPYNRSNLELSWPTDQGVRHSRSVIIYNGETGRFHSEQTRHRNPAPHQWFISRNGWLQEGWPAAMSDLCPGLELPPDLAVVAEQDSPDFASIEKNATPLTRFPGWEFSYPGATGLADSAGAPTMTAEEIAEYRRKSHGMIWRNTRGARLVGVPRPGNLWELWELDDDDDVTDIISVTPVTLDGKALMRFEWQNSELSVHLRVGYPMPAAPTGELHPAFAMMRDLAAAGTPITVDGDRYSLKPGGKAEGTGGAGQWWLSGGEVHIEIAGASHSWPWRTFAAKTGWKKG